MGEAVRAPMAAATAKGAGKYHRKPRRTMRSLSYGAHSPEEKRMNEIEAQAWVARLRRVYTNRVGNGS